METALRKLLPYPWGVGTPLWRSCLAEFQGFFRGEFVNTVDRSHLVFLIHRMPGLGVYEPSILREHLCFNLCERG